MPAHGGYSPYPKRMGGGKPKIQVIGEGLNAQRGTGYSQERTSTVWLENHAIARAIAAAWSTNQRLANQTDPLRMTDFLPRWEKILAIPVPGDASEAERRAEVANRLGRCGQAVNHAHLYTEASEVLGDLFVGIEYLDISLATVHAPDGTYPWGTVVAGYPWYSTVAHVLVRMQKPTGYTDADFWKKAGDLSVVLDAILPAWVSFDWYRAPATGTPINVAGGPSAAGWYLDEFNLDILVFDV
jgi:hypothetical protein